MRSLSGYIICVVILTVFSGCSQEEEKSWNDMVASTPSISGKSAYLSSPFVTAGNRVYLVGWQDGSFPPLGWHIKDEMGGIWDHPIKLMDGFTAGISEDGITLPLSKADSFVNYPMASKQVYSLQEHDLKIDRWQFVPDHQEGVAIQYVIKNSANQPRLLHFIFTGFTDLRPTWLGERTGMKDTTDTANYLADQDAWMMRDMANPWFVVFGSEQSSENHHSQPSDSPGNGISGTLEYGISIAANASAQITFVMAGSFADDGQALETYEEIMKNTVRLFSEKRDRYAALAERSKLTIPDKEMQQAFEWLKYNADALIRTVPGIGTGICAGIPDYPWWFGVDSEYALQGYMAVGQTDAVYKTIHLLDSISNAVNGNGRIVHEVSTNGAVYNSGNINETPQYASLIREVYRWNGDKNFLLTYFPTIEKGLDWLLTENDRDHNLFPEGPGMMEIHGMDSEMIDVASYTQRAFYDASFMASELGKESLAVRYSNIAQKIARQINVRFWSEEFQSYADFIGTDRQALQLIDGAIIRADSLKKPWAVAELQDTRKQILQHPSKDPRPFVLHHNWVVNVPMEMKLADPEKARAALQTAERFVNPFGMFVTGIDRDESAGSDDGSFKGSKIFSYTGAVMTLPTGVQAVAENNYGRPDKALSYLKRMTRTFSYALPGSMYEVSPDYGMITQAWNIYGFAVPIVRQFFGITPDAANKKIVVSPSMPQEWTNASLENVIIGENEVSVFYKRTSESTRIKLIQTDPHWSLQLRIPHRQGAVFTPVKGKTTRSGGQLVFSAGEDGVVEVIINNH